MTKYIGNRIGYGVSVAGFDGGIYNTYSQSYLNSIQVGGWYTRRITATGGSIVTAPNGYTYHVFTSPGALTVSGVRLAANIDILLVAGGGSSGSTLSAGGGGGGIVRHSSLPVTVQIYPVSVGTGGPAPAATAPVSGVGNNGNPSTFSNPSGALLTAVGGGGGAHYAGPAGSPGGSGGGGGNFPSAPGGAATQPAQPQPAPPGYVQYGNPGFSGVGPSPSNQGAGGGGAGSGGPTTTFALNGGSGQAFPDFAYPFIAPVIPAPMAPTFGPAVGPTGLYGGGGGAGARSGFSAGTGGPGGGGNGTDNGSGSPGVNGTGGGGGSGGYPTGSASAGGDGIVIIRYN